MQWTKGKCYYTPFGDVEVTQVSQDKKFAILKVTDVSTDGRRMGFRKGKTFTTHIDGFPSPKNWIEK